MRSVRSLILAVWLFNVFGTRVGVTFDYLSGSPAHDPALLLHVPAVHQRRLRRRQPHVQAERRRPRLGRLQLALVWIWIMIWSAGRRRHLRDLRARVQGHRPRHETGARFGGRSSRSSSTRSSRSASSAASARRPWSRSTTSARSSSSSATARRTSSSSSLASFVISMNTATADGSRALYGISRDGLTIRELGRLNRCHVPGIRDDAGHRDEHPLRSLRRQHLRHPGREQHRLRARTRVRPHRVTSCCARTGRTGRGRSSSAPTGPPIAAVLCARFRRLLASVGHRLVPDRRLRAATAAPRRKSSASPCSGRSRCCSSLPAHGAGPGKLRTGARRHRRCPSRVLQAPTCIVGA